MRYGLKIKRRRISISDYRRLISLGRRGLAIPREMEEARLGIEIQQAGSGHTAGPIDIKPAM